MLLCTRIHHVCRSIVTSRAQHDEKHGARDLPRGAHAGAKWNHVACSYRCTRWPSACSELHTAPSLATSAHVMTYAQVLLLPSRSTQAAAGWRRRARDRTTISTRSAAVAEMRLRWPSRHRSRTSAADILLKLVLGFDATEGLLALADGRDKAHACVDARACRCTRP